MAFFIHLIPSSHPPTTQQTTKESLLYENAFPYRAGNPFVCFPSQTVYESFQAYTHLLVVIAYDRSVKCKNKLTYHQHIQSSHNMLLCGLIISAKLQK